ncbi:MAG: amidohydrolase, partial [Sphingomonadaceae bacterium]|nr:amidohydrolase [Sphingomonadaceae bacterium]
MTNRLLAALAALFLAGPALAAPRSADVIIRHATIVDVAGARTVPGQAIVVRGVDIVAVGADATVARSWRAARSLDAGARDVIPGLWDLNV